MSCNHANVQWHLTDCNENGWQCGDCHYVFGFRPDFDRKHTQEKVRAILFWLVEYDFMYVSNASEADGVTAEIARLCRAADEYDQQTIVYLLAACGRERHAKFWQERAKQFSCSHAARAIAGGVAGGVSRCDACGHEVKQQSDGGPLFAEVHRG